MKPVLLGAARRHWFNVELSWSVSNITTTKYLKYFLFFRKVSILPCISSKWLCKIMKVSTPEAF